jgi:hypothetical protein
LSAIESECVRSETRREHALVKEVPAETLRPDLDEDLVSIAVDSNTEKLCAGEGRYGNDEPGRHHECPRAIAHPLPSTGLASGHSSSRDCDAAM